MNRRAGRAGRARGAQLSRRAIRYLLIFLVGFGLAGSRSPPARADGAFPDSFAPLLPRTRPHQILLATNFGLVSSDDDGASWAYACELPWETFRQRRRKSTMRPEIFSPRPPTAR